MNRAMTKHQEHALSVIRKMGDGVVWIASETRAMCRMHECSFSPRTVRALAAKGALVRDGDKPEQYRVASAGDGR